MCRAESGTKMKFEPKTKLDRRNMEDSKNLNSYIMIAGYALLYLIFKFTPDLEPSNSCDNRLPSFIFTLIFLSY